jgi:AcrR family transcriptional regulator
MSVKRDRAARAESTRNALRRKARLRFAQKGYADASTDQIVRQAGVTKGALYHHFADKLGLFRAVVEDLERELTARIEVAAARHDEPWQRLQAMCRAYLDACLDADLQRILVLEAPVVLGWRAWCEIDRRHGLGAFAACLGDVIAAGLVPDQSVETVAQVLLGTLNTGARVIATAPDPAAARERVGPTIDRLLEGLRAPLAKSLPASEKIPTVEPNESTERAPAPRARRVRASTGATDRTDPAR